jgi:hypothetical protein
MDHVFFLLWAADVADCIGGGGAVLTGLFFFISVIAWLACTCITLQTDQVFKFLHVLRIVAIVTGPVFLLQVCLPSKSTLQAAAASQAVTVAANTQLGQNAVDALNRVLKKIGQ